MIDFDAIAWDEPDDPRGNVRHIAANGVTMDEVEEVLRDPASSDAISRSSGRPARFGLTSRGRPLFVVYEVEGFGGSAVLVPVTAYEVPSLGDDL